LFGVLQEFLARCAEHRMNDLLEPPYRGGIVHHLRREACAVDLAANRGARERRLDRRRGLALVEAVNRCVGVVDRHPRFHEQFRGGRFAHSDRTGQPKNDHREILHAKQLFAAQKRQQRQKRQPEDSEMITLDPLEQMHAQAFQLVSADARCHSLARFIQIGLDFGFA